MSMTDKVSQDTTREYVVISKAFEAGEITQAECRDLLQELFNLERIQQAVGSDPNSDDILRSLKSLYIIAKSQHPFI